MGTTTPKPQVRSLLCPKCGGNIELRGFEHTRTAVCIQCLSVLDVTNPELQIISRFDEKARVRPILPLGTRGKLRGTVYELIGFQVRTITVEGLDYSWHEYLVFNPYKGFRYLVQYNGHWNDVIALKAVPQPATKSGRKAVQYGGKVFGHFQHSIARTSFVMGEFPWTVRAGETASVDDYVSPPAMISSEQTDQEITWSYGEYITGAELWQAFQLPGTPPPAIGVFENQPSPYGSKIKDAWGTFLKLALAWALVLAFFTFFAQNREVFRKSFQFAQNAPGEHSLVTDMFDVPGRTSNVEVDINADVDNDWAYFNLALINEQTGQGYDFGREVSYYHGRDSDGNWAEGGRHDSIVIPRVPAGRYYLRIEPEMEASYASSAALGHAMAYEVVVRRDVPSTWFLWLALPLLMIPALIITFSSATFEGRRWQESDYAPSSSSGGDDD
jgi:hypothetical protein